MTRRSFWGALSSGVATVATLITSLAAVAALLFTGLSLQQTRDQNQLAESGQITDRFNAAVANLGSSTQTIRIGGIYALQRIMQDSPRDQLTVVQVLAAFVREEAPVKGAPEPPTADGTPAIDVQTALTVLATRNPSGDGNAVIDLDKTDLSFADLAAADLADAELDGANLTDTYLAGANLTGADLTRADLTAADLAGANLTDTYLVGANLTAADLAGADLDSANLDYADLNNANLEGADLRETPWCAGGTPTHPGAYMCQKQ